MSSRHSPVSALGATLDRVIAGDDLPPLLHWLYFLPVAAHCKLDVDGHPRRGGFLPRIPLQRRMWAGGRPTSHGPLQVGDSTRRTSTILSVNEKFGHSGQLVFLTLRHVIEVAGAIKIDEEQDIVYRDGPLPGAPLPQPEPATQMKCSDASSTLTE